MPCILQSQNNNLGYDPNAIIALNNSGEIGISNMECIYEYKIIDRELNGQQTHQDILQIAKNFSLYSNYYTYRTDSAIYNRDEKNITGREYYETYDKYSPKGRRKTTYNIVKNYSSYFIEVHDRIFMDKYVYEDSLHLFNWKMGKDTLTVCGYLCYKAECDFRGRHWTAYYTPEIPVSDGPWKFNDLPGLILKIGSADRDHRFTAIALRTGEKKIRLDKRDYIKTNRKKFNRELKYYNENARSMIAGSPLAPRDVNGKEIELPNTKLFHNPVELE
jgi:GLPGLI family protein